MALVWVVAANLGLGPFGRIGVEFAFHATMGAIILHPLARRQDRRVLPYLRIALADKLLEYAREGPSTSRPRGARRAPA
jgi:hypothetical protein